MKMLARSVLIMEMFVLGFALLLAKDLPDSRGLILGGIITLLAFLAAGMLNRKSGWILGWLVQISMVAYGFVVFTMFFLGALFLGLWVAAIVLGRKGEAARAAFNEGREGKNSQ
jgi:cbb3-type cytochrome oxidase subunit 3